MINPSFSTLGSIIEISRQGPLISFVQDDSIRDLLGFDPLVIFQQYNLSHNPVDMLSFDNFFLQTDIAQGMIFKGQRTGMILVFTIDVAPGYKYIVNFRRGAQWYMMESKDFISNISFELRNGNESLVSIFGQSFPFRLSTKEM